MKRRAIAKFSEATSSSPGASHRGLLPWIASLVFFLPACQSARKVPTPEPNSAPPAASQNSGTPQSGPGSTSASSETYGPPEPVGPPAATPAPVAQTYGPEPTQLKPIVLVLGPGMA